MSDAGGNGRISDAFGALWDLWFGRDESCRCPYPDCTVNDDIEVALMRLRDALADSGRNTTQKGTDGSPQGN